MNIFDVKESKIKAFLKYLNDHGATSKSKAVKIEAVESGLRIDDTLFDEITRYVVAQGFAQKTAPKMIHITKQGVAKLKG
jgi:hypothetical protein